MRFGAVFIYWKCYGEAWCGFQKSFMQRCGPVRFSDVVNPTVRFSAVFQYLKPTMRRCGFREGKNPTDRWGAVNCSEPHRTHRKDRTVNYPGKNHTNSIESPDEWITNTPGLQLNCCRTPSPDRCLSCVVFFTLNGSCY